LRFDLQLFAEDSPEELSIGKKKLKIWKNRFKIVLMNLKKEVRNHE